MKNSKDTEFNDLILPSDEQIKRETTSLKISRANAGRVRSDEAKAKVGNANRGRSVSEDTRKKLVAAHLGKPHSESTKRKISEGRKNVVLSEKGLRNKNKCYFLSPKGRFESFKELVDAFPEHSRRMLRSRVRYSKEGFSMHSKDMYE